MTISKTHNNMLFMLASLACGQKDNSSVNSVMKQRIHNIAAVSDISDDDTSTIRAACPAKEILVARRRRRPLKKRRPSDDYRPSPSTPLLFFGGSIKPRKSLLEASIDISNMLLSKPKVPAHQEFRDEKPVVPEARNQDDDAASQAADDEMPSLVCDDSTWKHVHSPLDLPSFLPCPATALKNVKSIDLTIEVR